MAHKHIIKAVSLTLAIFVLAACQPTPEQEIVQNRLDGDLEAAILAGAAAPYRYEAPERWVETLEIRGRTVRIDAEVVVADAKRFPVLTIAKETFNAERGLEILTAVFGEAKDLRENEYSYDEALADLQQAQKGHYYVQDDESGWRPYKGQVEDIARLQQILAELGPEDSYIPLTAANLGYPILGRVARLANDAQVHLWGYTNRFSILKYRDMVTQLELWVMDGEGFPGEEAHKLENIVISEEDAIREGDTVIAALGRRDFKLALAERARAIDNYSYEVYSEGYLLTYVSCTEGACPVDYANLGHMDLPFTQSPEGYAAAWTQERIWILVTDEGVLLFDWTAPKTVVNTANKNVMLLPFEEIQERIRNLLSVGLRVDELNINNDALISRIVLGTAIQQIPNQGDEAFLVPAWVVSFTTETEQRVLVAPSSFMLNALDGMSISAWLDYEHLD